MNKDEQGPKLSRGFSVATQALPQNAMARLGSFAARPAGSTGVNLTTRHSQPVEGGDVCGAKRYDLFLVGLASPS